MQPGDSVEQDGVALPRPQGGPSGARKLLHVAMAVVPAAGWWLGYGAALAVVLAELLGSALIEVARRRWPVLNDLLWRLLPTTFRPWEGRAVLGSTWLGIGALATLLLYGRDVGGTAILFLVWGDPMAELFGRWWGRQGAGKTWAGSAGCLAGCLAAAAVGVGLGKLTPWAALAGAVAATAAERWSPPPDDNVWMPLLSGLAVVAVEWLAGAWVRGMNPGV